MILTPICKAEFLGFSYGFRPGRGAHNALDALAVGMERRKIKWIPDVEIRLGDTIKRRAPYAKGSGTRNLTFRYDIQPDDGSHGSLRLNGDSLRLNEGTIRGAETRRDASLDHPGASIAGTPSSTPPLTAEFRNVPQTHAGYGHPFKFELHFSHEIAMSYVNVRDHVLSMLPSRGKVEKAKRRDPPSNKGWEITVDPQSHDDIVITLPATDDCSLPSAVCTSGGQKLQQGISQLVAGLPALSISDAEVREVPHATLDFVLTLSRNLPSSDAVRFRTVDGTAKAGQDYGAGSGYVVFDRKTTTRTITVPVHDDAIDEGTETMIAALGGRTELSAADERNVVGFALKSDALMTRTPHRPRPLRTRGGAEPKSPPRVTLEGTDRAVVPRVDSPP